MCKYVICFCRIVEVLNNSVWVSVRGGLLVYFFMGIVFVDCGYEFGVCGVGWVRLGMM